MVMLTKSERIIRNILLILFVLFLLFIVFKNSCYADVSINGNILMGLELKRGSTHENRFSLDGHAVIKSIKQELELGGEANYTETDNVRSENKYVFYSTYRDHTRFWNRLYWFGNLRLTKDEFNDINFRLSVGPGLGFVILDSKLTSFYVELSPNFVHDQFKDTATLNYFSARWKLYISHWILDKSLKLFHQHLIFKKIELNDSTFDVKTSTGVDFPLLIKGLFLRVQYDYDTMYNYTQKSNTYDSRLIFKVGFNF